MIDAKSAETGMLLERIDKIAEVYNLLLDRVNIRNGSEGLTPISLQEVSSCANCSRFNHVELECPIMAIQGQGICKQCLLGGPTLQGRPNFLGAYLNYYNTPVFNKNPSQHVGFLGTMINPILHHTMVSNNINNPMRIKDNHRSSRRHNGKPTRRLHARLHRHQTRSSERSCN